MYPDSKNSTNDFFELPDWLEERRLPDSQFSLAYEACPAKCRAAFKTAFALSSFIYGKKNAEEEKREFISSRYGFIQKVYKKPLSWCAFVFNDAIAPARAAAATILPILANVPHIFGFGESFSPGLLTALELCGIADLFLLNKREAREIFNTGCFLRPEIAQNGKLVIFTDNPSQEKTLLACNTYICVETLPVKANILVASPKSFDLEILDYTQNISQNTYNPSLPTECILADKATPLPLTAPLILEPGCEAFWAYPYLKAESFVKSQNHLKLFYA